MLGSWINQDKQEITLILTNFPCSYNKCNHCAFDLESKNDEQDIILTNKEIIDEALEKIKNYIVKKIKIFNGGSFFELPDRLLPSLKLITTGKEVIIESRPEFLTIEAILSVFQKLAPSRLNIFIGFDSADESIRNKLLNKGIPQSEIKRIYSNLKHIDGVFFFSYVLFGIKGISEESVRKSILFFNKYFEGVSAIEFRKTKKNGLNHQEISASLKKFLKQKCIAVDFKGEDDEQWVLPNNKNS